MTRRPTIGDVAAAAGVSRTTVSHALNDSGRVDPATRAKIRETAQHLGYRPSPRAQALRAGRSKVLGVASSMDPAVAGGSAHLGFFMEIAAAAAERCFVHGWSVLLVPPVVDEQSGVLAGLAMDGVIVVEPTVDDPVVSAARGANFPFVTIGRAPDAAATDLVVDLGVEQTASLILSHLVGQGARNLLVIVGDQDRESYRAARAEAARMQSATPSVHTTVVVAEEHGGEAAGRAAAAAALAADPSIDAVAAWVDAFAVGAVEAIGATGRSVPDDVVVATRYDGLRARSCEPRLTAIDLALADRTRVAVDLLVAALAGGGDGRSWDASAAPATPDLPVPQLIARRSTTR